MLLSGNMDRYPLLCADATATFAALSDNIIAIRRVWMENCSDVFVPKSMPGYSQPSTQNEILANGNDKKRFYAELVSLINVLQTAESEKLQYTAALHLERVRLLAASAQESGNPELSSNAHSSSSFLLRQNVDRIREEIKRSIEIINDVLEDITCRQSEVTELFPFNGLNSPK
jgi:hypothetical protein